MRRYTNILTLTLLVILSVLTGCTRRPLDIEYIDSAELTVILDWSKAELNPDGATIMIYPAQNSSLSSPIQKLSHEDTVTVSLPLGFYSIIAINETFEDFDNIKFRNTDQFEAIEAFVEEEGANKAGNILSANPDILASASLGDFEVTATMIEETRSKTKTKTKTKTKAEEKALIDAFPSLKLVLQPQRVVYPAVVTAYVEGMNRISSAGAYVTGFTEGVFLATNRTSIYSTTQMFTFTERTFYDGSSENGYLRGTFNCFGLRERADNEDISGYTISFRSVLIDGNPFQLDRDVSHNISEVEIEVGIQIQISLGANQTAEDTPIVIPQVEGSGAWDVNVGEWEDVIIPIEL